MVHTASRRNKHFKGNIEQKLGKWRNALKLKGLNRNLLKQN